MQVTNKKINGLDVILKNAFLYWSRSLGYQILFSIIYFSFFLGFHFFALEYYQLTEVFLKYFQASSTPSIKDNLNAANSLLAHPNLENFKIVSLVIFAILFPLNIGLYKIFYQMDQNKKPVFEDLFSGYLGMNFFVYTSYGLFWIIIFNYTFSTIIFGVFWVLMTLFTVPLQFFNNIRTFDSIRYNFLALKRFSLEILVSVLLAFIFKYIGLFIFFIGFIFTFPFTNAIIFTLYKEIFIENKEN